MRIEKIAKRMPFGAVTTGLGAAYGAVRKKEKGESRAAAIAKGTGAGAAIGAGAALGKRIAGRAALKGATGQTKRTVKYIDRAKDTFGRVEHFLNPSLRGGKALGAIGAGGLAYGASK
jgi:hypothetical protein